MDIKSAFLQGMKLSRNIYIRPLPEAESNGTLLEHLSVRRKEINSGPKLAKYYWVARQSRPDVMFDASNLASGMKCATVQTIQTELCVK